MFLYLHWHTEKKVGWWEKTSGACCILHKRPKKQGKSTPLNIQYSMILPTYPWKILDTLHLIELPKREPKFSNCSSGVQVCTFLASVRLCFFWCYVLPIWSDASKFRSISPNTANISDTQTLQHPKPTKYPIPQRQTSLQWSTNSNGKLFFWSSL